MPTIEYSEKELGEKIRKLLEFKNLKYKSELLKLLINNELEKMKGDRLDKLEFRVEQLSSYIANLENKLKILENKIKF